MSEPAVAETESSDERRAPRYRTPVRLEPGETRAVAAAQITEINDTYLYIVQLMTEGSEVDKHCIDGVYIPAHQPLTLVQAAKATGQRVGRAREMMRDCKAFQIALNAATAALRKAEAPRNLRTAIEIRDDEGDKSAATKTVRLKAIQSIEGTDRAGVSLTINNTNTQNNLRAGYVMDLTPQTKTIEATATEIEADG